MKLPMRILAPIGLAIACTGILIAVLWWQLVQSTQLLKTAAIQENSTPIIALNTQHIEQEIDPGDASLLHLRQGDLLGLQGDWSSAQEEYKKSVEQGGGLPALRKLAQAQLQRRDMEGLRSTISKLKLAGAKEEDMLLLESIVLLRTAELVRARDLLEQSADSPQKHYGLALLNIIEENHPAAQEELSQTIQGWEPVLRAHAKTLQSAYDEYALFPESPGSHLVTLLSRALAQVQECELALPLLNQVVQTKDDYRDAWIVRGYCELTTERADEAILSLEQAYNLDPQKPEIQYFLGRAYYDKGEFANAIIFLEYAATNGFEPESEVRSYIARAALQTGDGTQALNQYRILIESLGASVDAYEGFVTTALALGNTDDAHEKAQEAVEKWPEKGMVYQLLGQVEQEKGNSEAAQEAFAKASELDPFLEISQ